MKISVYSKPKICMAKEGWYVYFRFEGKKKVYKYDLNRIEDEKEKQHQFELLRNFLEDKLHKGWNPFSDIPNVQSEMTLKEAIDFALAKKLDNVAPKTYSGYKGTVTFAKKAIDGLKLNHLNISKTKRAHIRTIMEKIRDDRKLSRKAYNKHLDHFKAVLSELIQWDILETNPAHKIKKLSVSEATANRPPTYEEHETIKNHLEIEHPNFYNFIITLFHTGMRPKEILLIKLNMVNLKRQEITLPPEITKTNRERIVPINNHLLKVYEGIDDFPSDFYLFGAFECNHKHRAKKNLDFIPAPNAIKRDTATKRWNKIVKTGLDIDVNLYSYKHFGANQKILAGISIDAIKDMFGHTSKLTTKTYITNLKEINRHEIINKSPDF